MSMNTIEEIIDKHYDQMFREINELIADEMEELRIEVQTNVSGKTVVRSWKDREARL